jgi:hypothetical protein
MCLGKDGNATVVFRLVVKDIVAHTSRHVERKHAACLPREQTCRPVKNFPNVHRILTGSVPCLEVRILTKLAFGDDFWVYLLTELTYTYHHLSHTRTISI